MEYKRLEDVAKDYPEKDKREEILREMNNEQIDTLISNMGNIQGKIYLKGFKK